MGVGVGEHVRMSALNRPKAVSCRGANVHKQVGALHTHGGRGRYPIRWQEPSLASWEELTREALRIRQYPEPHAD